MAKITDINNGLSHETLLSWLDYDKTTGIFRWKKRPNSLRAAGDIAGCNMDRYIAIGVLGFSYRAHRLAWFYMTGKWPINTIDHRDLNRSNNAFGNLRDATMFDQSGNMPKRKSKSGFRGVYRVVNGRNLTRPWAARIQVKGVVTYLGYFDDPREAAELRDVHARRLFGEFYSGDPALMLKSSS